MLGGEGCGEFPVECGDVGVDWDFGLICRMGVDVTTGGLPEDEGGLGTLIGNIRDD